MIYETPKTSFGPSLSEEDWGAIRRVEANNNFYHTMQFPDGKKWNGDYELPKVLKHYHLPEDMSGKSVLDVGPADGFFSFLAEERNASQVLAIQPCEAYPGFVYAHRHRQSKVQLSQTSIYTLNNIEDDSDRFDYVFCFSVLLHLPDLYSAITGLCNATRHEAYIATVIDHPAESGPLLDKPYVLFNGETRNDGINDVTYHQYWYPNSCAMIEMGKLAGFSEVEQVDEFHLSLSRNPPRKTGLHGVYRCRK